MLVEAESFTNPSGTIVVPDTIYSGGLALKIADGQAVPTKEIIVTERSEVSIRARAGQTGGSPTLTLRVDGVNSGTRRIDSVDLLDYEDWGGVILEPGTYTLGLKAGDVAQGRNVFVDTVELVAVVVEPPPDTTPPVVLDANSWPEEGGTVPYGSAWEVAFYVTDETTNRDDVQAELRIDGDSWQPTKDNHQAGDTDHAFFNQVPVDQPTSPYQFTLGPGLHTVEIRATDLAGNISDVWTRTAVFEDQPQ